MLKVKTSELTNISLDWAVAKCEDYPMGVWYDEDGFPMIRDEKTPEWKPSTDWSQGGPIIEREHISIEATRIGGLGDRWMATVGDCAEFSDAPLIAAMRCYVASKLGDTVDIPKELM